jgi:hypothetical protein
MSFKEDDLLTFAELGFAVIDVEKDNAKLFCQGKDFGVYLLLSNGTFSIDVVCNPFSNRIFYWQHFDSFDEIKSLIVKNHVLSEQICENAGLAIYT